jgi:ABC-type phosphate/phosphonate transport system ATPase subunit
VGPNNAGKSAALRELQQWIARSQPQKVIANATLRKVGTSSQSSKN